MLPPSATLRLAPLAVGVSFCGSTSNVNVRGPTTRSPSDRVNWKLPTNISPPSCR